MKTGTLRFDIYGNLSFDESIETFIAAMDPIFSSISSDFDSEWKRFGFFACTIVIVLKLDIFWKNDSLYKTVIKQLDRNFDFWRCRIRLNYFEKG